MRRRAVFPGGSRQAGFTLVEMIVVVFLLALAMVGILAVFDASARINKSEQDVADAQGNVRYGIYQMTRAIRIAGAGGLFVSQAVLNAADADLAGITVNNGGGSCTPTSLANCSYDNVENGTAVTSLAGSDVPVRPGTDMIEVRGVIGSPILGFDNTKANGCDDQCNGASSLITVKAVAGQAGVYPHVNQDAANRPQFAAVDAYTAGAATSPMLVIVVSNLSVNPQALRLQPIYNVGKLSSQTRLVTSGTFTVDFTDALAKEFNSSAPSLPGTTAQPIDTLMRGGILDDLVFFIDNSDPNHPALAQGTRRGNAFDIVTIADDVEDMQIAYGVDTNGDNAIGRLGAPVPVTDPDENVSNQPNQDEWAPNVPGETPYTPNQFYDPGSGAPLLRSVMISLVAKSRDPDPTYHGPVALGMRVMNSPVTTAPYPDTAKYPGLPGQPQFRRRVQTLKINLRNYAFEG